jgi:hypothetical protein
MIGFAKPTFKSAYDNNTEQDFAMQVIYTAAA